MLFSQRLFMVLTFVLMTVSAQAIPLVLPDLNKSSSPKTNEEKPPEGLDLNLPEERMINRSLLVDIDDYHHQLSFLGGVRLENPEVVTLLSISHHWRYGAVNLINSGVDLGINGDSFIRSGYGYRPMRKGPFRPEVFIELGTRIVGKDRLATLIKTENWFFRPGFAVNYNWYSLHSLRAELGVGIGQNANEQFVKLGYLWAWR